jgi:AcrR family transcriptional regulator
MSRREDAKEERRKRIIEAARSLIRETGDAGLSMRALAARAGVSLATPYNLFGSKRAIVLAVLDDVKDFNAKFRPDQGGDPFVPFFEAAKLSISYYQADPAFYRTLWVAVFDVNHSEARSALWSAQRDGFWRTLLHQAKARGALADYIDLGRLQLEMDFIFRSAMLHWVLGELSIEKLDAAVCYGYALALKGAATDACAPLAIDHLIGFQARLLDDEGGRPTTDLDAATSAVG